MIYLEYLRLKLRLMFLQTILWFLDKLLLLTRAPERRGRRRASDSDDTAEVSDVWQRHAERLRRERAEQEESQT